MVSAAPADDGARSIRAIALFETAKGVLALLAAIGLAAIGPVALKHAIERALSALHLIDASGGRASPLDRITPETVDIAIAVIVLYGVMRLIEGWGLWRHRIWASWLGCIGAAAYLPFEVYALWRHPDWLTWGVLLVNLLIVVVLARDIVRRR
ncbi:MAG: DUF2127 domain-containing protein [Luteimonas sp.]|nr:DUF2127 domain-containing protein [Luteimonas sp.]